jgi:hypothetical protein
MASTDSASVSQVFDALVALEDSFQRLDSNATRALVIRDARETIAALSAEQDRLLGTIAALNVELAVLRPAAVDTTPVPVQATWDDDGGGWWFDHDDDPETDFRRYNAMVVVQVPRSLWDRYLWLRDAWNVAALAVCDAAGLERNEPCRAEVCTTPTGDEQAHPETHCGNCGYLLDLHEVGP